MKPMMLIFLLTFPTFAQLRPVHTFSIVARDPQTGEMGVAVQSHAFSVGPIVAWAEAGVGAIATQSLADPSYGKLGLDLMRAGKTAPDTLLGLLNADKSCEMRQVAMIDSKGNVSTFTGTKNIAAAGGIAGQHGLQGQQKTITANCGSAGGTLLNGNGYSVQANLMSNDQVWPAMADAFRNSKGDLAERMLAALDAAQSAGGDIRGKQSAALIIVKAQSSGKPWEDTVYNLRVDDNPEPLKELRRLALLQRAYNHSNEGDRAIERKDDETALREYSAGAQTIEGRPDIPKSTYAEFIYWHAVSLVAMKRVEQSLPIFKKAFELEPNWREVVPRLSKAGLLPDDETLIRRILSQ